MQGLESLGVTATPTYIVNTPITESPNNIVAWAPAPFQQTTANGAPYTVMNVIKQDQAPRVMVVDGHHQHQHPPQNNANMMQQPNPSVITATSNPTYNRCLPKILSDLDCEMKIKQVLKCIESILLDGNDIDQQSYKLPDRSLSPQLPKKKLKKDDDEISLTQANMNIPPPAGALAAQGLNKSGVRINVKAEPSETEKAARTGALLNLYQDPNQVSSPNARGPFDFGRMQPPAQPQPQAAALASAAYGKPQANPFPFNPYAFGATENNSAAAANILQQHFLQPTQHSPAQQQLFIQQQLANHQQHLQNVQRLQAAHQQNLINAGLVMAHPISHALTPQQLQYLSAISATPQQMHQATPQPQAAQQQQQQHQQHQHQQQQHHQQQQQQYQQQAQQQQQQQHQPQQQQQQHHIQQQQQPTSSPRTQSQAQPQSQSQTSPTLSHAQHQQQHTQTQGVENGHLPMHMEEFPFPVFSHTIFEEVNQKREEKKDGADEPVFFFGNSSSALMNPNPMTNSQLIAQMQAQFAAQQGDAPELTKQSQELLLRQSAEIRQNVLGSSLNLHNLPLLLSGHLEEDDKWYLSLLNIDGVHEVNPSGASVGANAGAGAGVAQLP